MPVEDHEVHERVRHINIVAGCNNLPRERKGYIVPVRLYDERGSYLGDSKQYIHDAMSVLCRNIGEFIDGEWREMSECRGCNPDYRDWNYIHKHQQMHEAELRQLVRVKYRD